MKEQVETKVKNKTKKAFSCCKGTIKNTHIQEIVRKKQLKIKMICTYAFFIVPL